MRPRMTTAGGASRRGLLRGFALAVALSAVAMTAAVGVLASQGTAAAATDSPTTFTVGITNEVDSFNPFNGIEAESYEAWALMYDYMITYSDKDMSPQPGLASSWDTSADGLTWTFHIRTGVTWSDGEDLTAADIAYTYNRILDGGPESASWGSYLGSVEKITAPDAETVILTLSEPNAVLPLLPMPIVPEHIWKDVPEDDVKTYSNEPPDVVGSGPFRLIEGKAGGSTYRFEPNTDYWKGTPSYDELDFRVFKSEDTLVQALKAGEIDFAEGVTPLQVKALEGNHDITALTGDSPGFDEVGFNVGSADPKTGDPLGDPNPAVLDPAFRFALSYAIDRQTLVDKTYQGAAKAWGTVIPPAYTRYQYEPPDADAFAYDPGKAEELLDAAGYTVGSDGSRQLPNGDPIGELRLYARSDSELSLSTMNFVQEWLADIHIDSKVIAVESSKLTNIILEGEFDMFQWGWYVEPDPDSILSYFTCGQRGGWSDSWYCDPRYDRLYKAQHAATDQSARERMITQMQQMLYEDMPYLVTATQQIGEAYRSDRWEGFVPQPNPGGILLFQYGIANYLNIQPAGSSNGQAANDSASSGDGISSAQVIGIGTAGVALFVFGGALGGWAGYRKATVDYRE
ncbi:MAG: ABC transporter substrate-binding protein [Nocardioidaceae bacterium]